MTSKDQRYIDRALVDIKIRALIRKHTGEKVDQLDPDTLYELQCCDCKQEIIAEIDEIGIYRKAELPIPYLVAFSPIGWHCFCANCCDKKAEARRIQQSKIKAKTLGWSVIDGGLKK